MRKPMRYLAGIAILFVLSLSSLTLALEEIPMRLGYAIGTGIGIAGGVGVGICLWRIPLVLEAILALIVARSVGLKFVSV